MIHYYPKLIQLATQLAWTKSCSSLLKILDEPAEESGIKIPDLMDDAGLLEWAGVTTGKAEVRERERERERDYFILFVF